MDTDALAGRTRFNDLAVESRYVNVPKYLSRRGRARTGEVDEVSVFHGCVCSGVCVLFLA